MIFSREITAVNESEFDALLEQAENRFEYSTMLEAGATVVYEMEQNWTKLWTAVGMDELRSVMENGEAAINEGFGDKIKSFIDKAIAYFKVVLNKLAELTKAFITKLESFVRSNDAFVKKYGDAIKKASIPSKFEFKGYNFDRLTSKKPKYDLDQTKAINNLLDATKVINNKDTYTKENAEKTFNFGTADTFREAAFVYYFGSKEKETIKTVDTKALIDNIQYAKVAKKSADDSYKEAAKSIKNIIKELEKSKSANLKIDNNDEVKSHGKIDQAFGILISYWKAYGACCTTAHSVYCSALGHRCRQSKAIAVKLLNYTNKKTKQSERNEIRGKAGINEKKYNESAIDSFLGAVEFI